MLLKKIPEAEFKVMEVIWNSNKPLSSKEIVAIMEEKNEWKNTTTLTLLSRLCKKGFINFYKQKRLTYYTDNVSKKSYLRLETNDFFQNIHKSSLKSFITTLHETHSITDKDLDELEEWIKNR